MVTSGKALPRLSREWFITALPNSQNRYPLPMIRPRDGRTDVTPRWLLSLRELALALGLDPDRLGDSPATFEQFRFSHLHLSPAAQIQLWQSLVAEWRTR